MLWVCVHSLYAYPNDSLGMDPLSINTKQQAVAEKINHNLTL